VRQQAAALQSFAGNSKAIPDLALILLWRLASNPHGYSIGLDKGLMIVIGEGKTTTQNLWRAAIIQLRI
jgi:hypothetical protein